MNQLFKNDHVWHLSPTSSRCGAVAVMASEFRYVGEGERFELPPGDVACACCFAKTKIKEDEPVAIV